MKKIILSAAIAAICAAPATAIAADHNLYGQFRASVNSIDDTAGSGLDGLSVQDNVSLFGLKGEVGDDIKAFYHLQTGAPAGSNKTSTTFEDPGDPTNTITVNTRDTAFNQRFYFAGIKGGFGKLAYGRMTNAYKFAGFKLDPFYNMSTIGADGKFSPGLATYGLSPATNGFTDGAAQYTSPSIGGVKINAGVYIDASNEDEHGTGLGAEWSNKSINAGIQLIANGNKTAGTDVIPGVAKDGNAIRVHGGYKGKSFKVGASFEVLDNNTADDPTYLYVTGTFNVADKTRLVGSVGIVGDTAAEGTGLTLSAFQTVAPKTELYVLFSTASLDNATDDPSVLSIGAIHKFGFGG